MTSYLELQKKLRRARKNAKKNPTAFEEEADKAKKLLKENKEKWEKERDKTAFKNMLDLENYLKQLEAMK